MKFGEYRPRKGCIPCLSVRQPWAWLIVHQAEYPNPKTIENREWKMNYRGPLLIHAGKQLDADCINDMTARWVRGDVPAHWKAVWGMMPEKSSGYPTGGIVGIATLVDVVTKSYLTEGNPWFTGPYGFVLKDAKPLPFTPYKGELGLFSVPESVLEGDVELPPVETTPEPTPVIAPAEERQRQPGVTDFWALSPEQQYQVQQKLRQERKPGRCVIEVNGKRV